VRPREGLGLVKKIVILFCREKDPIRPNCSPIIVLNELLYPVSSIIRDGLTAPLKRRSTIILHGGVTQKTTLNTKDKCSSAFQDRGHLSADTLRSYVEVLYNIKGTVFVHVNRVCLLTAATNGPVFRPPDDILVWRNTV
jgi:hypothetical protein